MTAPAKLRRPCDNCPWRVDAPRGHWADDHFEIIWQTCQDDGMNQMLCHKTNNQTPAQRASNVLICQGWVRVMQKDATGVRIALMLGRITEAELLDRKGPRLFTTFEAMLRANGIVPPPRNQLVDVQSLVRGRMRSR